jgi:hypothetical protein
MAAFVFSKGMESKGMGRGGWVGESVDGRKGSAVFRQRNVLAKEWAAGDLIEVWWGGDGLFKRS